MNVKLPELIKRWLHYKKMPVSSAFLKEKLLSHPDYPSLLSITDTLDDLSIENAAIEIDKEKLHQIPVPFIAHVNAKGGDFILVTDTTKLLRKQRDFLEQWKGVVLLAERPESFHHPENENWLNKEKKNKQLKGLAIIVLIVLVVFAVSLQFSWLQAGLVMTTIAGLFVSLLIVQHELGISNSISERLCTAGKNTDCNAVLHSKKSKLFSWLNWADMGIIWFCSQFLLLFVSLFTGTLPPMIPFLCVFSIASLPFTLFSFYYQWRVVKKWCTLCLLVITLLLIQFFILIPFFSQPLFSLKMGLLISGVLGFISIGWVILKEIMKSRIQLNEKIYQLLRFKYNHNVFNSLLKEQPFADIISFQNEIQLGNAGAELQITVTSSLTCSPCSKAHETIENILNKLGDEVGVRMRFLIRPDGKDKNKMLRYVLEVLEMHPSVDLKKTVLHDWYKDQNFEKFKARYPISQPDSETAESLILLFRNWSTEAGITSTPTIFINNRRLPPEYSVQDLENFLRYMRKNSVDAEMNVFAEL